MSKTSKRALTVGEIARRTNQPLHRVEYVVRARRIEPDSWAGNLRVFSDAALERIARELAPGERTAVEQSDAAPGVPVRA